MSTNGDPSNYEMKPVQRKQTQSINSPAIVFTSHQLIEMEREFDINPKLPKTRLKALSSRLGIKELHMKGWFAHRRQKLRNKTKEKSKNGKRFRTVFTEHQILELEREFNINSYLANSRKKDISKLLGIEEEKVKVWFQNRRMKIKNETKKNTESYEIKEKSKGLSSPKTVSSSTDRSSSPGRENGKIMKNTNQAPTEHPNFYNQYRIKNVFENFIGQYGMRNIRKDATACYPNFFRMPLLGRETQFGSRHMWNGAQGNNTLFNGFYQDIVKAQTSNQLQLSSSVASTGTRKIVNHHGHDPDYRPAEDILNLKMKKQ